MNNKGQHSDPRNGVWFQKKNQEVFGIKIIQDDSSNYFKVEIKKGKAYDNETVEIEEETFSKFPSEEKTKKYLNWIFSLKLKEGFEQMNYEPALIPCKTFFFAQKRPAEADPDSPNLRTTKKIHKSPNQDKNHTSQNSFLEEQQVIDLESDTCSRKSAKKKEGLKNLKSKKKLAVADANADTDEPSTKLAEYKGSYLYIKSDGSVRFFKVQVLGKSVKLEQGIEENENIKRDFKCFENPKHAENFALKEVFLKLKEGYIYDQNKFSFDFNGNDAGDQSSKKNSPKKDKKGHDGISEESKQGICTENKDNKNQSQEINNLQSNDKDRKLNHSQEQNKNREINNEDNYIDQNEDDDNGNDNNNDDDDDNDDSSEDNDDSDKNDDEDVEDDDDDGDDDDNEDEDST